MLEIWLKKAQADIGEHGFRWLRVLPPGLWIIITVGALIGGRLFWVNASRPANRQEITAAFGSAGLFYGVPQMNHRGSQFAYVATDDQGYALFLRDIATGKKQVMVKQAGFGEWGDSLDICPGPWSPDDRSFIYSARGKLFLCPVDTNLATIRLDLGGNVTVSDIVWLNPLEFVWLDNQTICYARMASNGQWDVNQLPHRGRISSVTAVDAHTFAWLEGNYICRLNLTAYLAGTNDPFAPLSVDTIAVPSSNDLLLWLDASTLQQSNQTPVTSLMDLSHNKNSAGINQNPPTFNASNSPSALNRKGTIHFESGHASTAATGLKTIRRLGVAGFQSRSIFAVLRRDVGRSRMMISLGKALPNGAYFDLCDQHDYLYLPAGSFPDRNDGRKAALPPSWHVLEMIWDGTNGHGYVNGAFLGTATLPANVVDTEVELGLRTGEAKTQTNVAASDGDFAELLVYDRALNPAEQREVEDYLGTKWFGNLRSVSPHSPFVWLDPQMSGLTGFKYSKETGCCLISRAENGRDSLWRLDARTGASNEPVLVRHKRSLQDAQWIGMGEFDYVGRENGHQGLLLADSTGIQTARLFAHEDIPWFQVTPNGKKMLFFGNVSNCPSLGIWQYDFDSHQVQSVAPWSDHPSIYARNLAPLNSDVRLPSGRSVHCTIYPPANFDPHRKYPLLLGNTLLGVQVVNTPTLNTEVRGAHGRLWVQCMATGGAFVVIINRNDWLLGIEQWEENIMGVYQSLVRDPCIDANQVFLFGASAETAYLSECLARSPELWKGAIYLSPTALPDFSKSPLLQSRPKIMISIGSEEKRENEIRRNQADNLNYGVIEEVVVHPGEAHRIFGNSAQLERTRALMHFLFEE